MKVSDNHSAYRRILESARKDPVLRDTATALDDSPALKSIIVAAGSDPQLLTLAKSLVEGFTEALIDHARKDSWLRRALASAKDDETRRELVEGSLEVARMRTLSHVKAQKDGQFEILVGLLGDDGSMG